MDNKRLQEIKERYDSDPWVNAFIRKDLSDLITAYEAAQAELAEARDVRNGWKDYSKLYKGYANEWSKDNADLRAQLAEAQEQISKNALEFDNFEERTDDLIVELEAQLAASQAEVKLLQQERKDIGEAWNIIKR